jgi:deaminated glutathione amidase
MSRIALIQTRTPDNQADALAELEPLVREAAEGGARLIATPEGSNLLQRDRVELQTVLAAPEDDAVVQGLIALARSLKVEILIGSALVRRPDGLAANRAYLIRADGEIAATYDKIHMFDVDLPTGETARESQLYTAGDTAVVVDTGAGRLGLTICYDVRFPGLFRALARAGAEIIAVPAAFTRPTGEAHWEILLRARAIECGCYVIAPAQGGRHADGRGTWGHSLVVGPWGEVVAKLDHDHPGVLFADLDLDASARARSAIPALKNERAFTGPLL